MKTETKTETHAAHTPGPWRVAGDPPAILSYSRYGNEPEVIAQLGCDLMSPQSMAEMDANARLIAAAPETRKAAEALARVLREFRSQLETSGLADWALTSPDHPLSVADDKVIVALAQWEEVRSHE